MATLNEQLYNPEPNLYAELVRDEAKRKATRKQAAAFENWMDEYHLAKNCRPVLTRPELSEMFRRGWKPQEAAGQNDSLAREYDAILEAEEDDAAYAQAMK